MVTVYYGNYTDYVRAKKGLPPLAEGEVSKFETSNGLLSTAHLVGVGLANGKQRRGIG